LSKSVEPQQIIAITSNAFVSKSGVSKNKIILTTPGRALFNEILPNDYKLLKAIKVLDSESDFRAIASEIYDDVVNTDKGITKSEIGKIINEIYAKYDNVVTSKTADAIKNLGFEYATESGISFSVFDFPKYTNKYEYIDEAKERINLLEKQFHKGLLTDDERYIRVIET
jgi:DNA-directed RNA polymerase subunit beta'